MKDMNRHFTEGDTQRANKPMQRCSASLASRKTHTKTTKCHLKQKPVTTPKAEKLHHIYTGGGMQNGTAIRGKQFNSFFKKKLNIQLPMTQQLHSWAFTLEE